MSTSFTRDFGSLNSHDLLKCLALLLMVIDHVGTYFFPDIPFLRVIGRASFPIWFFLAGYRTHFTFRIDILCFALLTLVVDYLTPVSVIPLDILWTYLFATATLGWLIKTDRLHREPIMVFVAAIITLPVTMVVDYGTVALLFACCGYMRRHHYPTKTYQAYLGGTLALYVIQQAALFEFDDIYLMGMAVCVALSAISLYGFTLHPVSSAIPRALRPILKHLGRHTLYYYVGHLLIFQITGTLIGTMPYPP